MMAGSYNHLVGTDGKFTVEYLDNMGDTTEALLDCFDIIAGLKRELCEAKDDALHQAGLVADYRRDWLDALAEIDKKDAEIRRLREMEEDDER